MCGEEGGERAVAETACADQKRRILGDPAVSRSRSSSSLALRPAARSPNFDLDSLLHHVVWKPPDRARCVDAT